MKDYLEDSHPGGQHDVTAFTITPGYGPGDAFQSELVLLDVWVKVKEGGSPASQAGSPVLQDGSPESPDSTVVHHLAAKFYSLDLMNREMNKMMNTGQKEYLVYTKIIKELNEFQADRASEEPRITIPQLIYGRYTGNENVLLMENLKIHGYNTFDKRKGLDFEHLKVSIEHIARVHALSHAFYRENDFRNKYPCFRPTLEHLKFFKPVGVAMLDIAIAYFRTLSDKRDVTQRLEACKQSLLDKYSAIVLDREGIMCLNHGDYWINNIMYSYKSPVAQASHEDSQATHKDSQEGHSASQTHESHQEIEALKIIDWGTSSWGNPIFDLQYLLYTSTTRAIRSAHLDRLLHLYHSTFTKLAAKLGSPAASWSYEQFELEWERTSIAGFLFGCTLSLGTLSTSIHVNEASQPSCLDKPFLLPIKVVVNGIKIGMAKLLFPLLEKPIGERLTKNTLYHTYKPIIGELCSGQNEVMNKRLIDIICEADEKGIFSTESVTPKRNN
ncbi:uncharacterized protein [Cherax quadricarinatus]|uniref:uncharacterized protein isoform X1 n=1 Tax=Cherax quadricarinatus TaxID=27406 RepID=UPI00387E8B03